MGINHRRGVLTYAPVSGAVTRHHIKYYKNSDDFDGAEKCDVELRAYDKTKPISYNSMRLFIVQRKKASFSAKSAENRYCFTGEIALGKRASQSCHRRFVDRKWINRSIGLPDII